MSRGDETDGAFGALRKACGTFVAGKTWYAVGSWRKEKSLAGRSWMPRADGPSLAGEVSEGASERAGDMTRDGRLGLLSANGLQGRECHGLSVVVSSPYSSIELRGTATWSG